MASDRAIGRYRRWYARLLHLYPRPFRERFGEPMAQTFTDLCRERTDANRGLHAFALGTFAETSAQIMRENMTQLMPTRNYLRWVLITAAVLALPPLAMVFKVAVPDPGSGTDGVNWGPMDFAIMGVLILGSGLLFEYASARAGTFAHKAAVASPSGRAAPDLGQPRGRHDRRRGQPREPDVPLRAVRGAVGAAIARFEPREASIAMFATAGAQAVVAVIALVFGLGPTLLADAFFVAAWVASGLLFRRASEVESSPSPV